MSEDMIPVLILPYVHINIHVLLDYYYGSYLHMNDYNLKANFKM